MEYPIEIASYDSFGIKYVAEVTGITHMREIARGWTAGHENEKEECVIFFALQHSDGSEMRVADTGGDPVWEDEEPILFKAVAESVHVDL